MWSREGKGGGCDREAGAEEIGVGVGIGGGGE